MNQTANPPKKYRVLWNQITGQNSRKGTVGYVYARSLMEAKQLAQAQFSNVVNVRLDA